MNTLAYIDEALDALTDDVWTSSGDKLEVADVVYSSISWELERVESSLGAKGSTILFPLAEEIKRAVIALVMARNELHEATS